MTVCAQFPAENVRDWRRIERCIHDILAFTGAEGAAITAITARMKPFFTLCDRECVTDDELRAFVADLLFDRLKVESELYYARSLESVP
ncbi:MAG TPA: hypothetical protein VEH62_02430 [Gemmatimonadales bacterium]|nr:hypothetical protein [Gemmatimonadales bacterium]